MSNHSTKIIWVDLGTHAQFPSKAAAEAAAKVWTSDHPADTWTWDQDGDIAITNEAVDRAESIRDRLRESGLY